MLIPRIRTYNHQHCSIKKSKEQLALEKEWRDTVRYFDVLLLPSPSFMEWLALRQNNIL